jgi:sugar phosphate isomerase/epimerase
VRIAIENCPMIFSHDEWPAGEGAARRYAGVCHIDVERLDVAAVRATLERTGLEISALAYYPNNLDPDPEARAAANAHLRRVIDAAAALDVGIVGTFVGNDRTRPVPENLRTFAEVWPPLVAHAAQQGVRIAIENCPMIFSHDEWPAGNNLAYSPAIWREMFRIIPDASFGLNIDPSHLVWQMIDCERAIYEFGDRIFHAHGKDLEVRPDGLYEHGVMSAGIGWQVPRLCGLGQVDWGRFVAALYGVGYDHVISIEHEDRRFEGSVEAVQRGFAIARNTLAPLIA